MASVYKVLGQSNPSAATLTDAYTVPGATSAIISSIAVCNRSAVATTFRLAIAPNGEANNDKHYLAYDAPLGANEIWVYTIGATLDAADVARVYATLATVSFNIFGEELS